MLIVEKPSSEIDRLAGEVLRRWRGDQPDGALRVTMPHRIYSEAGPEKKLDGWGYVAIDVCSGAVVAWVEMALLEERTAPILLSSRTRTGSICGRLIPALQKAERWAAERAGDFEVSVVKRSNGDIDWWVRSTSGETHTVPISVAVRKVRELNPDHKYEFEGRYEGGLRQDIQIEKLRQKFIGRLGLSDEDIASSDEPRDLRDCTFRYTNDIISPIEWYDIQLRRQKKLWMATVALASVVGVAGVLVVAWWPFESAAGDVTKLSLLLGAIFGVLRIMVPLSNTKARLGAFWNARTDLKELLYKFEARWKDRAVMDRVVDQRFLAAVQRDLGEAAKISRTERERFFATYVDPKDLLDVARGEVTTVTGLATTFAEKRATPAVSPRREAIVRANYDRCRAYVTALEKSGTATPEALDRAYEALAAAEKNLSDLGL